MQTVNDIIEKKAAGSPANKLAWSAAIEPHPVFLLPEALPILHAASRPSQISALADFSRSMDAKSVMPALASATDVSDFTLSDWLESLEIIHAFLRRKGRNILLPQALGYVHCCAD